MSDTIAAISTSSLGSGGIGIVRISGDDAINIADKVFIGKNGKKLSDAETHTIHYGNIRDEHDNIVDEVLVSVMKAPNTYTREDVIEINTHGGNLVTGKVLECVLNAGAIAAEPGEFTKRAFLNGRIDLSKAEAVIDIINSKTEFNLRNSMGQLNGRLTREIDNLRDTILDEIAYMEAAMDDPENIPMEDHLEDLKNTVNNLIKRIGKLKDTYKEGSLLKEGITTVIVGKTNAGKSSLLNLLTGDESAIVTDIAGTTRDTVKEQISLGGILINLVDTAGIRDTDDIVEAMGIRKAKEHLNDADLVIYVVDSTGNMGDEDREIINLLKNKNYIVLLNKSDMNQTVTPEELYKNGIDKNIHIINFSTVTADGLEQLTSVIKEMFSLNDILINDEIVITNSRHKYLLDESIKSLNLALDGIDAGFSEDLISIDIYNSYIALGKILGKEIEDDLADRIFEKFCMGK
ncbi:MAG: tRNA uridine-5-carboxymethylaminomethyl(34) synthesis GTPase MnmE [Lachnospiraceae bacterium]|nr:tRNA uridine-5-carboxymethylaminomethyl(34) synthesis GTPase MnmE [Lachnospiraceae bacterium]MDY2956534.1 tRNA uridine-5-carboxymethylaminomethyl(34) synthesis GTPase MnmE [Lachnospiraceae bacterium]